ncbi:MAG: twitching motility protein PilT [Nitrospirales bacterium]|nr:MAG: twitching motility protein PilT [Nitrospirales bacterium]
MKILLDTHVFLWWMGDHKSLTAKAASTIKEGKNAVYVSAVTAWEISIKKALGKLKAPDELEEALEANRFLQLPITIQHGLMAGGLPRHHDDPFDRMLIAQAQLENLTIMTHDVHMKRYDIPILWT